MDSSWSGENGIVFRGAVSGKGKARRKVMI
jgi:hypothetical protein